MLKNRYDEILIGLNITSLVRGLIATRNNKSVLLIDDSSFNTESLSNDFISELEIESFLRIATQFDISELANIRKFLRPAIIDFNTDKIRLRVGASPFDNLREVLRKYPELIETDDLDLVYHEGEKTFDQFYLSEVKRFEAFTYEQGLKGKKAKYELSSAAPKWFRSIFHRFSELINMEYAQDKSLKFNSLLHLMSILFEEKMKTKIAPEEVAYYFFKLLSPQYRLQDFILIAQLKRRLMINGGDYKESKIQYWQFFKGRFENLLLTSFEGVISANKVLFFTHLPENLPFRLVSKFPFYRSVQMHVDKSSITAYPAHHVVVQTRESVLGSDKPFTLMCFDDTFSIYHMPYLDMAASKASFYQSELLKSYQEDAKCLPFNSEGAKSADLLSATLDLRGLLNPSEFGFGQLPLTLEYESKEIGGFEYWGIHKFCCLGHLGLIYRIHQM